MRISDWSSDVCSSDLMPELIERGYVYIGLPPLYKIKQGKTEIYLKDDDALNQYLVNNAVEGAELIPGDGVPAIQGAALERLMLDFARVQDIIRREIGRASCRERVCQYV